MNPRISIVMPVWNGEKYLPQTLESILTQTFTDFELIVLDDGSTDATLQILESYLDPRLRIFKLAHGGIVHALNYGIAQARSQWIARHDADDTSLPRRLEAQWNAVHRNRQVVLCHTDVEYINEMNLPVGRPRFSRTRSLTALRLCYRCPIVHSTVLFKKEAVLAVGGYLPEERHAEDFSLWGRMLLQGDFVGLPEKLVRFRLHGQSVSRQNLEIQMALAQKIGAENCRRFMNLSESDAIRANALLLTPPRLRHWRDWFWFLTRCAPRLSWHSAETLGWLVSQTVKLISG